MNDNADARRQRGALVRERRRGLWRVMAAMLLASGAITLLIAGALTWFAEP